MLLWVLDHHSAVDNDHLAGYVGRVIGCQKRNGRSDIGRGAKPPQRNRTGGPAAGLGCHRPGHFRLDESRGDRIYQDVSGRELLCNRLGEPDEARLARGIVRLSFVAYPADNTGDVDYPAPSPLHHTARCSTNRGEWAAKVRVEY